MKKVWIIAAFTGIEENNLRNRFVYLANLLSESGYEVTLFTSSYSHFKKAFINKSIVKKHNFNIEFIDEPGYLNNVSISRIVSHYKFSGNLKSRMRKLQPPDLIYVAYPTMLAAFKSESYAKKHNIPVILDVQDTWPESISAALDTKKLPIRIAMWPLTKLANTIYKNANGILGVSQTYVDRAKIEGSKSDWYEPIYIGSDLSGFDEANTLSISDKAEHDIYLIYIGTLSHSYDIETSIRAINTFESMYNIKLFILGDGPDAEKLINIAKELGVLNNQVFFKGYVEYSEMVSMLKSSDVALNAIKGESKATITNKLGDYLAAGLPLLNSCEETEIVKLVEDEEIGINYKSGDIESLHDALKTMISDRERMKYYGKKARILAENRFDRNKSYRNIVEVIGKLIRN